MFRPERRTAIGLAIAGLIALVVTVAGCSDNARAQSGVAPDQKAADRSITVIGQGSAAAKPDLAYASLGVETYAPSLGDAVAKNNEKMAAVMAKLQELGIDKKDIQTSNFNIGIERRGPEETNSLYRVSNMVRIKLRELDKVSSMLDAAVQAGANQVWELSFAIENEGALLAEARTKAMEDAGKRGEALATLANVKLGQILYVAEGGAVNPLMYAKGLGGGGYGMGAADAGAISVSPGEVEVRYRVDVTYAIE